MATLTVVSDLHLEARSLDIDEILDPALASDVLCLLGDIGDPSSQIYRDFLAACAARFPAVLLLAGNNEYRNHDGGGRTMAQTEALILAAAAPHPNVHFLQNSTFEHDSGVVFIGSTLWSYLPDTPLPPPSEEAAATSGESKGSSNSAASAGSAAAVMQPRAPLLPPQQHSVGDVSWSSNGCYNEQSVPEINRVSSDTASRAPSSSSPQRQGANEAAEAAPASTARLCGGQQQQRPPLPSQPEAAASSLAAKGGRYILPVPMAVAAPADRRPVPSAKPRFASYSQPCWLASSEYGTPTVSTVNGDVGSSISSGADGRMCRRRQLRHCVSLASLRPDEPCPSWRVMQARCSSRNGSGEESSNSSDGSSSSSRSGNSSSSSSASAARSGGSDSGDDALSDVEQRGSLAAGAGDGDQLPPRPLLRMAAAAAASGALSSLPLAAAGRGDNASVSGLIEGVNTSLSTSEPSARARATPAALLSPAARAASSPVPGLIAAYAAGKPTLISPLPTFLSDPGSWGAAAGSADGSSPCNVPASVPACAAAAASAAAPVGGSRSDAPAVAQPSQPSPENLITASTPHRHHQHHQHHRHSQTSSHSHHHHHHHQHHRQALPPPSTIREFIGATSLDFRRIFISPGGEAITPDDTNQLFLTSLDFIRTAVASALARGLVPVVLSHHAPSMRGTSRPAFAGHPSTHAYSTDLEPYLAGSGVVAWYCGHTHYNFDMMLQGGVRLASNQFGSQPKPAEGYSRTWQHRLPPDTSYNIAASKSGIRKVLSSSGCSVTSNANDSSKPTVAVALRTVADKVLGIADGGRLAAAAAAATSAPQRAFVAVHGTATTSGTATTAIPALTAWAH